MDADDHSMLLMTAALDLVRRTGAVSTQIRYSDDESPTVWVAVAEYGEGAFEAAAAPTPDTAAVRLAAQLLTGGVCTHCGRPSALDDTGGEHTDPTLCWYVYDGQGSFARGCQRVAV